jgi:outer membrane protein OmpA-like peptidoglycan-associated protein
MPGGIGGTDIWMCKKEGNAWSQAVNLGPVVNTVENEMFPGIRSDGKLFFASEGHPGYGSLDIFQTSNANGNWTTPVNMQLPINSSYDDFAITFIDKQDGGFFSSNRPGGEGSDDIYAFRVKEKPVLPAYISGLVKDKTTMQPIAGATVFLHFPTSGKIKVLKTDSNGRYKTVVSKPEKYTVKAMMPNYIADCMPFLLELLEPGTTKMAPRDLLLDKLVINKTFRIDNIYYDFDKYNIREDAKPELDKLVRIMNENAISVELGSHTDCRGTTKYNDKLSQKRAESAVKYIISAGIGKDRITAKGYGESQLVNACADGVDCTPEEHQFNRRTEFKVTGFTAPAVITDQFDPGKYGEGQEIESGLLPEGFFNLCK